MAERTQGTTQEPGRTPAADRASDMREQIREQGAQVQERAQEMGTQVRDWAQEKGSQIKEGAQEAMQQAAAICAHRRRGRDAPGLTLEAIALVPGHVARLSFLSVEKARVRGLTLG